MHPFQCRTQRFYEQYAHIYITLDTSSGRGACRQGHSRTAWRRPDRGHTSPSTSTAWARPSPTCGQEVYGCWPGRPRAVTPRPASACSTFCPRGDAVRARQLPRSQGLREGRGLQALAPWASGRLSEMSNVASHRIADRLRAAIMEGSCLPGGRIRQEDVAARSRRAESRSARRCGSSTAHMEDDPALPAGIHQARGRIGADRDAGLQSSVAHPFPRPARVDLA